MALFIKMDSRREVKFTSSAWKLTSSAWKWYYYFSREILARLCVTSNYPLKIIHSFNLTNTFYDLFRHINMSPDSHIKLCLISPCSSPLLPEQLRQEMMVWPIWQSGLEWLRAMACWLATWSGTAARWSWSSAPTSCSSRLFIWRKKLMTSRISHHTLDKQLYISPTKKIQRGSE